MNNDELGEKGEQRFSEWCVDAGLICNKSSRDRAGWDFVVDFPHELSSQTLDSRAGPRSCVVQTKTVLSSTKRVKVRLHMAERLAKEVKPAFIVVPVVHGLEITHAHVLHIRGEHLALILMRLRKAEFEGKADDIAGMYVTFALGDAERIEGSGAALRAAIERACPDGMDAYAVSKGTERNSLGYLDAPFHGTYLIPQGNPVEILDFFLGKNRNVAGRLVGVTETRFGIALSHIDSGPALLTLVPAPDAEGLVRMTSERLDEAFAERALVFMPDVVVEGYRKFEWRAPGLDVAVVIRPNDELEMSLEWRWVDDDVTIEGWARQTRALSLLQLPDSVFELEVTLPAGNVTALRAPNVTAKETPEVINHNWLYAGCTQFLAELMRRAGTDRTRPLSGQDVDSACEDILIPYALCRLQATLSVDADAVDNASIPENALLVGRIRIGRALLVWHGILRVSVNAPQPSLRISMSALELKGVRQVTDNKAARKLLMGMRQRYGIDDAFELVPGDTGPHFVPLSRAVHAEGAVDDN